MDFKHADLTKGIIGAFYGVYNTLGYGFLEKVYESTCAKPSTTAASQIWQRTVDGRKLTLKARKRVDDERNNSQ